MKKIIKRWLDKLWRDVDLENKNLILGLLERNESARILDIGCGSGGFTRQIADSVGTEHIFGLEIGRQTAVTASRVNKINVVMATAEKPLPFRSGSFDIVVSNQVLEHLSNTDNLIKEAYRILRNNGVCVLSTPNLASLHSIISLMLGYQPTCTGVSDETICGNPFDPRYGARFERPKKTHQRVFTARALRELFTFHGFHVEKLTGWGLHPLPLIISKHIRFTRYCVYLAVKARKPNS
jgi:2-polyprenyl-3-methyl-5-hydroxy-6-metoxy-1,4-benzoquinol methylase